MASLPLTSEKMQQLVWIAGPPRSGTTLLGKLLASGGGVEYAFEPPFLETLAACVQQGWISNEVAVFLLDDFLNRDLLVEQVLGRRQNFREQDDSHFRFNVSDDELRRRMSDLSSSADARAYARDANLRLVVKSPQSLSLAPAFSMVSEGGTLLIPYRRPEATIASMLHRQWFASRPLEGAAFSAYRGKNQQLFPPPIVSPEMCHGWFEANPAEQAAALWLSEWSQLLNVADQELGLRIIIIHYERLCNAPDDAARELLEALGIDQTPRTARWVNSVLPGRTNGLAGASLSRQTMARVQELVDRVEGLLTNSVLAEIA